MPNSITNTYIGGNDRFELTASFSTSGKHDMPDVDGGSDPWDARGKDNVAVWVVNNQDQNLTADLERAHVNDPSFSEPADDVTGVTVSAGGSVAVLAADPDVPMTYLRLTVSFSVAPTGSAATKAIWHSATSGE